MKAIRLLAVMMLVASLTGCMAKKAVIDESSAVVRVDTTKTVADSLIATKAVTGTETVSLTMTHVASDTTKFAAQVGGDLLVAHRLIACGLLALLKHRRRRGTLRGAFL